jgi:hypothetical protein
MNDPFKKLESGLVWIGSVSLDRHQRNSIFQKRFYHAKGKKRS